MNHVYIDHNVVDDISKGSLAFKADSSIVWVYSNEHFNEIQRAGDTRFLDVLGRLRAQKLELKVDDAFRITNEGYLSGDVDPQSLYQVWPDANAEVEFSGDYFSSVLSRFFGADNAEALAYLPESFEREVSTLLESAGLLDAEQREQVTTARRQMETIVFEHLAERPHLETQRAALGMHSGRAGNLSGNDNPLEDVWDIIGKTMPGVTADQVFGFDPPEKGDYEEWPLYLGIVGCYAVLNMIGLRPDEKLARVERMPAIMSDASHAGFAAYCNALLSSDRRFCDKARAIYRYKRIGTEVLTLERRRDE